MNQIRKKQKIGILGLGTVGSGVYGIINNQKKNLKHNLNTDIEVKKIFVRDKNKKRKVNVDKNMLTNNPSDILDDSEIDIVIEVMGRTHPAYEYMSYALGKGKHIVTANKEVVSKYMNEFSGLAEKNNKGFLFEASVGGGIPIIKSLKQIAEINDITNVKGILNGTTNFILSKMLNECLSFNDALKLARELGYVEADPTDDIEGHDVARKLSILASLAFKVNISTEDILYRGILLIDKNDILNFKSMDLVIKLIATASKKGKKIAASVEPILIDKNSQFDNVNDAFNIISITGSSIQELQFYGQGAGQKPTA